MLHSLRKGWSCIICSSLLMRLQHVAAHAANPANGLLRRSGSPRTLCPAQDCVGKGANPAACMLPAPAPAKPMTSDARCANDSQPLRQSRACPMARRPTAAAAAQDAQQQARQPSALLGLSPAPSGSAGQVRACLHWCTGAAQQPLEETIFWHPTIYEQGCVLVC